MKMSRQSKAGRRVGYLKWLNNIQWNIKKLTSLSKEPRLDRKTNWKLSKQRDVLRDKEAFAQNLLDASRRDINAN